MSISDELRRQANCIRSLNSKTHTYKDPCKIERLADRIDAEMVELPKDADGVPIHVGDVMEERSGHTFEVASLMAFGGSDNWLVLSDPRNFSSFREPHDIRHHHAPTVEDVLREFAEKVIDSQIPSVHPTYEEAITEYAAKLRLADDGEEEW